jgi:hypothetical protein
MEKAMDRERQIELLEHANERAKASVAAWLNDPKVKDILRRNHDSTREIKNPRPVRRACG